MVATLRAATRTARLVTAMPDRGFITVSFLEASGFLPRPPCRRLNLITGQWPEKTPCRTTGSGAAWLRASRRDSEPELALEAPLRPFPGHDLSLLPAAPSVDRLCSLQPCIPYRHAVGVGLHPPGMPIMIQVSSDRRSQTPTNTRSRFSDQPITVRQHRIPNQSDQQTCGPKTNCPKTCILQSTYLDLSRKILTCLRVVPAVFPRGQTCNFRFEQNRERAFIEVHPRVCSV